MKALALRGLVVSLVWAATACGSEPPKEQEVDARDRFVGEWKSADTNSQTHTFIKRSGDTFFIHEGKQDIEGTYDAATQCVMIQNEVKKVPVKYLPETDQLLITGGSREARFSRVKYK
ncbi:hypothetical protein [Hymenobacter ruricola]|uniref:Lipocalin-like domain-containing protein n=1 Tax=Hymenobacter ruricola TaxID=2791023 RepID=A0ABS0I8S3_9BACT|nr:hypothetical protein [Hymenobacter ruricola]MBF9223161.1 hypothetical protein [Hymenobacter ruricola]